METPSFPEYPSGHSTISSTCSFILTRMVSPRYKFEDKSQVPYGGIVKRFSSFDQAAREAGMSRYYGGIHYMNAINDGYEQGQMIGRHIMGARTIITLACLTGLLSSSEAQQTSLFELLDVKKIGYSLLQYSHRNRRTKHHDPGDALPLCRRGRRYH